MKIIKEGDPKNRNCKKFTCGICGCVFESIEGEWSCEESLNYAVYICRCPYCGHRVGILEKREHLYDTLDAWVMKKQYLVK